MKNIANLTQELSILYVEDDQTSREQTTEIFELLFDSVETTVDGEEALQKYEKEKFDIIITDINMPNINGLELIKQIKKIDEEQPIIIISAHSNSEYLLEVIELGVEHFIIKPIQMQHLISVLKRVADAIHAKKILHFYHEELEQQVEEKTAILAQQYVTDELTGLKNRNAFIKKYYKKHQESIIVLISIDNFNSLLITYGYDNCDYIIQELAQFLKQNLPEYTELYRIDDHDFSFVSAKHSVKDLHKTAQKLQQQIASKELFFEDLSTHITISVALAKGKSDLLKKSHMALKEAQKLGKNRLKIYTKDSPTELLQHKIKRVMPKLKRSIEDNNVLPYFQPIINNKTNTIEKYECLARIVDDDGIVQSPADFIDVAELTGMLSDITRIMIDKSFMAFKNNKHQFSINISEYDLNDGYLREYLKQKCKEHSIESSRVVLEVLEGVSVIGAKNSLEQLMNLKLDGFLIAIDDFGVQNSNFERVHSMHVDYIKIDGSFIKDIHKDSKSYNVVKTINDFGKSIDAKIIAEYVHSKEVQEIVKNLGIEYSQGYYFSQPLKELQN